MLHNGDPLASLHFPPQGNRKTFSTAQLETLVFSVKWQPSKPATSWSRPFCLHSLIVASEPHTSRIVETWPLCQNAPPSEEGPSEANLRACQSRMMSQASLSLHRWVLGIPTNWWTSVGVGHESVIKIYSYSNKSWFLYSLTSINTYLAMQSWG